jgi:hypothetical protein
VAKKASQPEAVPQAGASETQEANTPDVLGDFAADLGQFLGGVQSRASSWLQQRKDIADQLTQIRDTANQYLQQLGAEGSHLVERFEKARRGRPPGSAKAAAASGSPAPAEAVQESSRPKRTMSPEARARIAEAQRKRWAKQRKVSRNANR